MKQQLSQPTPVDKRVGEQLEMLRRTRGLTQQALVAEMAEAGVRTSVKVLCMIENGQRVVTQAERSAFAQFFRVKIAHLTGPEPEAPRPVPVRFGQGGAVAPVAAVEAAAPLLEYALPVAGEAPGGLSLAAAVAELAAAVRRSNELTEMGLGLRPDAVLRAS